MALHAVRAVGDAVTGTRRFLTPFDVRRWLKLAVVVFFVGGGTNLTSMQYDFSGVPDGIPEDGIEIPFALPTDVAQLVGAIVVGAVLLAIAFGIVGAIMEFVFVESLRSGDVLVRRYWSQRWRQGLRLFGFRVAIGLPFLGLVLGWMALFVVPLVTGISGPTVPFAVFLLGLPVLFVVGLLYGLVSSFTTAFVVPIMIKEDTGVLAGWRRLWSSITAEWKEYLAYAVLGFLLTIATGLLASIALGLAAVVLLVPLVVLAVVTYLTVSLTSTIGLVVVGGLVLLFVVTMIVLWALVQVPVLTYLRYYALLVLGDVDASFDIIADQRAAIRSEE